MSTTALERSPSRSLIAAVCAWYAWREASSAHYHAKPDRDPITVEQAVPGELVGIGGLRGVFDLEQGGERPLIVDAARVDIPVLDGGDLTCHRIVAHYPQNVLPERVLENEVVGELRLHDDDFRVEFRDALVIDSRAPSGDATPLQDVTDLDDAPLVVGDGIVQILREVRPWRDAERAEKQHFAALVGQA